LSEVGVGSSSNHVGAVCSRALILDLEGNPTTLTILVDEILDVTYVLRVYIPNAVTTGSLVFTGNKGGTYNWSLTPARVTAPDVWIASRSRGGTFGIALNLIYDGNVGGVTSSPAGVSKSATGYSEYAYVPGSYTTRALFSWGITTGSLNISSALFYFGNCVYQIQFNPAIPKTDQDNLSLAISHSWGRL
jgi:hypothetical protein